MAVTLRDIAREVNLSHATVSFVLNDRRDVAIPEATRARVLEVATRLGYRPNRAARALAQGRTQMVAVWLPTTDDGFYATALHHVQLAIRGSGYEAIVCQGDPQLQGDERPPRLEWPVDGVLAIDCALSRKDIFAGDALGQTPLVHAGIYSQKDSDHVEVDLRSGIEGAIDHLSEQGCRRIALVASPAMNGPQDPRHAAYTQKVKQLGLPPEVVTAPSAARPDVRKAIVDHIEKNGCPDGLLCCRDDIAIVTARVLSDLGCHLAQKVAVIGCDGTDLCEYLNPPLSAIDQPIAEMCRVAWEFLLNRIDNPDCALQSAVLQPALIVRDSSMIR